jgi:hypothetical protein
MNQMAAPLYGIPATATTTAAIEDKSGELHRKLSTSTTVLNMIAPKENRQSKRREI